MMRTGLHRRHVLGAALGGAAAAILPGIGVAQEAASAGLRVVPLGEGLILVGGPGFNVVAAVEPDGLVLVDGGPAAHSDALLDILRAETGTDTVRTLFNTHWHPDQTGLNERVGRAGGTIVAHENTRLWLTATVEAPYDDRVHRPLPAEAQPNDTFYKDGVLELANGQARYAYMLQAHTDGDLYVHFPQANVIAAGGALKTDGWADIDWWTGGWIGGGPGEANNVIIPTYGGMVGGLQRMLDIADGETVIVPASGPVADRAELEAQFEMYVEIARRLRAMMFESLGPEEMLALEPAAGLRPEWGSPDDFLVRAFQSLWPHLSPDA